MERYFPNDCLVTGYDIIPFWVNRMTFQSLELNGVRPFKDVVIHGLVRDKEGRKMSKSLGNGMLFYSFQGALFPFWILILCQIYA